MLQESKENKDSQYKLVKVIGKGGDPKGLSYK